ncbi:hypothetical protein DAPPUDRAFT_302503 [Daphnia pulex]|uniref:Uncharacterized protein n=1 Tax=Daphnia pulex TaxID=6669 RepID=E9I253_DAPPU|nr:hypothetical protein DAPPUDRAFT_302503 [Daphnia pulex]|eukprot:EFX61927.1 hypothetical protein DAPPUDRAFT_302503 [Daphnia pulex]
MVEMINSTYRKINHYDKNEEVRQNLQPLPDTREMMNAIYRYYIMLETKSNSVKNEIKSAIDFVKKNFTSIIPSVESSLSTQFNNHETIVDLLITVYGEYQIENLKRLSLFKQTLSECKTNFTEVKEHLETCRIESRNVATLVSLQYEDVNSFGKNEWNATPTEMLKALLGKYKWIEEKLTLDEVEIKNVKDFVKTNLTNLFYSETINSCALLYDNDTAVDLLKKVYGELKNHKMKLLERTEECKTSLMHSQTNFNVCKIENGNVANLVSFQYKDLNSKRKEEWKELTILGANATTTEVLNALQEEWKWISEKLILDEIEIKTAKDFAKANLTDLFSSEGLTSMASLNDNDTTMDLLRKVYFKIKSEKANFVKFFNQSTEECKTKLTQFQSNLNLCNIENENVSTLVSLHYKEINSSRNKEWKELPKLVSNATTTEMLKRYHSRPFEKGLRRPEE